MLLVSAISNWQEAERELESSWTAIMRQEPSTADGYKGSAPTPG